MAARKDGSAPAPPPSALGAQLDALWREYDHRFLATDPVAVPHEFAHPADQEAVALVAAVLAYGNVRQILRSVRDAVGRLGERPAARLRALAPREAVRLARGFKHRFNGETDLARLYLAMGRALRECGSLEALFLRGYERAAPDVGPALEAFVRALLEPVMAPWPSVPPGASNFDFLLPLPSRGSACKRLNLFLRWMVRRADGVDFGLWCGVQPAQLVVPLDTHVWRIARALGLTARRTADWRAAVEITGALRRFDPDDPVRFDFAIARLGIVGRCRRAQADPGGCRSCALAAACREAKA